MPVTPAAVFRSRASSSGSCSCAGLNGSVAALA